MGVVLAVRDTQRYSEGERCSVELVQLLQHTSPQPGVNPAPEGYAAVSHPGRWMLQVQAKGRVYGAQHGPVNKAFSHPKCQ